MHCDTLPGLVPHAAQQIVPVVEQVQMARDTYRIRLRCPEIAKRIVPGQFFMVRVPGETDPLLGRPFALYDVYEENGEPAGVDFGYVVVGKLTRLMTRWKPGDRVEIWGPLGNGFPISDANHLVLVAGGIGQTPFLAVAREALGLRRYGLPQRNLVRPPQRVTLCYGARSAEFLAGLDDFSLPGLDVRTSTDDGSAGHRGFVTELLSQSLTGDSQHPRDFRKSLGCERPDAVYCCGPEPMMHATADICAANGIACWLSLETPMACGFGACFSCVTKVRVAEDDWDYRRTCVEGPVFPAKSLVLT